MGKFLQQKRSNKYLLYCIVGAEQQQLDQSKVLIHTKVISRFDNVNNAI